MNSFYVYILLFLLCYFVLNVSTHMYNNLLLSGANSFGI